MIKTSQYYNEKIKDLFNREIYAKVQVDYTDPEIDQSIVVNTNTSNYTSYPYQIVNGKNNPNYNYLSLDGSWVLGDEQALAPSEYEIEYVQFGLWGSELSNTQGTFNTNPILELKFLPRPIRSLKLVGDSKKGEFPVDFMFRLYNEYDEILYADNITNNDSVFWTKDIVHINEVVKMEIEIVKWNKPNRVIKIMEVFSSIQEIYEGEDIISINLIEERETSQGSLPVGNISSNEIEVVFNNVNRQFDVGNVNSNLYGLVKPNRKITAWIGIENELIPIGLFWTKDWDVSEDGVVAKTIGRDRLDRLRDNLYSNSILEINKSIYDLAENILLDSGLKIGQYWIDEELKDTIIPYSYFKPVTHRDALRQLVSACLGQVYCDRNGIIRVEGASFMFDKSETITTAFLQPEFPSEMEVIDAYGISGDDYFTKNNPSRQSNIANHITVETQPLVIGDMEEVYSSNEPRVINPDEEVNITINFNTVPCTDVDIVLSGVGEIIDSKIYSWGADITVLSNIIGEFTIKANGKPLRVENKDTIIVKDNDSILENGMIRYEFKDNHLIQSVEIARDIGNTLLKYYKDPRRDLTMEWRGNPALELGDIVVVNDYPRDAYGEQGYYYITKQEMEFAGYLRANMEGRRV